MSLNTGLHCMSKSYNAIELMQTPVSSWDFTMLSLTTSFPRSQSLLNLCFTSKFLLKMQPSKSIFCFLAPVKSLMSLRKSVSIFFPLSLLLLILLQVAYYYYCHDCLSWGCHKYTIFSSSPVLVLPVFCSILCRTVLR